MSRTALPRMHGVTHQGFHEILTAEALTFVGMLDQFVASRRADLLETRARLQAQRNAGQVLDFDPTTAGVRRDPSWQVAPVPPALKDRRCEITGPPTRKMTVNALNSGASVWMADFEDATAPTWFNVIDGQRNLRLALRGELAFTEGGKHYSIGEDQPTVMVRPRGWHLDERHLTINGVPLSASMVDFGLYLFHNASWLIEHGAGPYFYLPKLESHHEARLWNDVFVVAEGHLGLTPGTIRATVLVETFPAAFAMEEILWELRDHSAGLNAGRWDYIFSYLKTHAEQGPDYVLPDRTQITMTTPMMRAYSQLLVDTCHRRGAQAIGGMSAFVPNRHDPAATDAALAKVAEDKSREAADGFDGSWVAHPGLVDTCRSAFDTTYADQWRLPSITAPQITAQDLIARGTLTGPITSAGLQANVAVSLRYLVAWVGGSGATAIDNLMEDAATVEISRAQIWQWLKYGCETSDGVPITRKRVRSLAEEAVDRLYTQSPSTAWHAQIEAALEIFTQMTLGKELPANFPPYAYARYLVDRGYR